MGRWFLLIDSLQTFLHLSHQSCARVIARDRDSRPGIRPKNAGSLVSYTRSSYPRDLGSRSIRTNRYRRIRATRANRVRALDSDISRERGEEWTLVCGPARPSGRRLAPGLLIPPFPSYPVAGFSPSGSFRPLPLSHFKLTLSHIHTVCMCVCSCASSGVVLRVKQYDRAVTETRKPYTGPIVPGPPSLVLLPPAATVPSFVLLPRPRSSRFSRLSHSSRFESTCPSPSLDLIGYQYLTLDM